MKLIVSFSVFVLVLICLLIFFVPRKFPVSKISCQSQFGPCNEKIANDLQKFVPGEYLLVKKSIDEYFINNGNIEKYSRNFKLPGEFEIYIVLKKNIYAIKDGQGDIYIYTENFGYVEEVEETSLPILNLERNLVEPHDLSEEEKFFLELLDRLFYNYQTDLLSVKDGSGEIRLENGIRVIFPSGGEIDYLLGSLEVVRVELNKMSENSRIEKEIKEIDLRFTHPVLR